MSRKVQNALMLASGQSLGADFFSDSINVKSLDNVGLIIETQGVTIGSGTFFLQARSSNGANASQWVDLTITPAMSLANDNNFFAVSLRDFPFSDVRVRYLAGSPSDNGSCGIWVEGKGGAA